MPVAWDAKMALEDAVRKSKRSHSPCPHCSPGNVCAAPYIRCGERMQFSTRETPQQRTKDHFCNYRPFRCGSQVLIVSPSENIREFLARSFILFMSVDPGNVLTASCGLEAVTLLNECKMKNTRCRLVVCDIAMADMNGFELVNEIYGRNWDTNIILMQEKGAAVSKPEHFAGDMEILPGDPLVKAVVEKPFHSADIVRIAMSIM